MQAFLEWVPVRGMRPGESGDYEKGERSFSFGDLATLVGVSGCGAGVTAVRGRCTTG